MIFFIIVNFLAVMMAICHLAYDEILREKNFWGKFRHGVTMKELRDELINAISSNSDSDLARILIYRSVLRRFYFSQLMLATAAFIWLFVSFYAVKTGIGWKPVSLMTLGVMIAFWLISLGSSFFRVDENKRVYISRPAVLVKRGLVILLIFYSLYMIYAAM